MVHCKHKGLRSKSRYKTKKNMRDRGKPSVNKMLKKFSKGQTVYICINSSIHSAMPHRRFNGKTGVVTGMQGKCYKVKIKDMNACKEIIIHPVHLTS
ncbi:MAG: 50S ribosomal protein L21e [Candidatus Micrarchaeota archaeon]